MRKQIIPLLTLVISVALLIGAATSNPGKYGAMVSTDGTGNAGTWVAMTGTGAPYTGSVTPAGLMVSTDGTGNPGTWVAATASTFGGNLLASNNTWTGNNTWNGTTNYFPNGLTAGAAFGYPKVGDIEIKGAGPSFTNIDQGSVALGYINSTTGTQGTGMLIANSGASNDAFVFVNGGGVVYYSHLTASANTLLATWNTSTGVYTAYTPAAFGGGATQFDANGVKHENGTAPSASAGTLTGTNHGGYITGLSAATTVTITFANSGWNTWSACTASPSVSLAAAPYVSSAAPNKAAVTFTFPSLTGALYYNCNGN